MGFNENLAKHSLDVTNDDEMLAAQYCWESVSNETCKDGSLLSSALSEGNPNSNSNLERERKLEKKKENEDRNAGRMENGGVQEVDLSFINNLVTPSSDYFSNPLSSSSLSSTLFSSPTFLPHSRDTSPFLPHPSSSPLFPFLSSSSSSHSSSFSPPPASVSPIVWKRLGELGLLEPGSDKCRSIYALLGDPDFVRLRQQVVLSDSHSSADAFHASLHDVTLALMNRYPLLYTLFTKHIPVFTTLVLDMPPKEHLEERKKERDKEMMKEKEEAVNKVMERGSSDRKGAETRKEREGKGGGEKDWKGGERAETKTESGIGTGTEAGTKTKTQRVVPVTTCYPGQTSKYVDPVCGCTRYMIVIPEEDRATVLQMVATTRRTLQEVWGMYVACDRDVDIAIANLLEDDEEDEEEEGEERKGEREGK